MTQDLENLPSVTSAASGRMNDGELLFKFPGVLDVIRLCTSERIAVLGLELLNAHPEGYYTDNLSVYDLQMSGPETIDGWPTHVAANNALAMDFVRANPTGDNQVYVLTTSSWREFCKSIECSVNDLASTSVARRTVLILKEDQP
jgi:hypothetical protein